MQQPAQPQQYQLPVQGPHLHHISPGHQIDSLFQQLSSSSPAEHLSADSLSNSMPETSVISLSDEPVSSGIPTSNITASNSSAADRQSALLNLLSGATGTTATQSNVGNVGTSSQQQPSQPQIPTPPGSAPTHSEAQGKFLLEQLMTGQPTRSSYSGSQQSSIPDTSSAPPYSGESDFRQYVAHDPAVEHARNVQQPSYQPYQAPYPQPASQPQNRPPSPPKSMFDFVSPFDALTGSGPMKKKSQPAPSVSSANDDSGSWTAVSGPDPKRQSVDNLLETLARSHIPPPSQPQPQLAPQIGGQFDPYHEYSYPEQMQIQVPAPPPQQKQAAGSLNRAASPSRRPSPSKTQAQRNRAFESPVSQQGSTGNNNANRRDKESSPGPGLTARGSIRGGKGKNIARVNNVNSPGPQLHNVVFDVSQPLEEIQAPRDYVKCTPIALVKQDPVFLPGSTIGATHWVAYAMTKGRLRIISRASGDRTLLQLPSVFSPLSSVIDMAAYGNRLAGVTMDGGFVVWEFPEIITDDAPAQILLCIGPSTHQESALTMVKWHPKDRDTLVVASESQLCLIDLANAPALRGQVLTQSELQHIGQIFPMSSPLVAFDFDVLHYAIATLSADSTLTIWNVQDQVPYSTHKVRGEDYPSSLTFVEGGIVVGRKCGTIFQLLSMTDKTVLSTVKFINGSFEDPDMFGHACYDSRVQTLWVANSRRESMIGLRINLETVTVNGEEAIRGCFEQALEFSGTKASIHFVILTADSDPNGDEAYAACVASKVPPGELALAAFAVHSSGVDQVLIRKEWYENALITAQAKLPLYATSPQMPSHQPAQLVPEAMANVQVQQQHTAVQNTPSPPQPAPLVQESAKNQPRPAAQRPPSPTHVASQPNPPPPARVRPEPKTGRGKKNVNWKEKEREREREESVGGKDKNNSKAGDGAIINESALGQALSKEIKRTEENLHTRISRLLSKEMDKQNQRFEDARIHEQEADFARQEKILKLISSELTRNTTRVVEVAVKNEVQTSVLPSLEAITRKEVRDALNDQVGRGLVDVISQRIPVEMEKLLTRPDISGHYSHILSSQLTPMIERHLKEAVNKTFIPVYSQQTTAMHQELVAHILHLRLFNLNHSGTIIQLRRRKLLIQLSHLPRHIHNLNLPLQFLQISGTKSSTDPELIIPLNGTPLVSQAVILTLVHRLSSIIGETNASEEIFKTSLWWLQRLVSILRPEDKLITDFIPRLIPNVQVSLNTTKQRLTIPIPGVPPTVDVARTISDIQDNLRRKVALA
ncbi:wd40 repeat-containing nuclear protein [Lentinula edodes]|uniref:Wd40 repeat-containing nuclear protein n=1 Tax=Lentinula edodes TaxID=5353 RepID=A0A1Q3EGE2_LENED|nr:wd40 repeat-containing nuclear protein [Lentinula edodes]